VQAGDADADLAGAHLAWALRVGVEGWGPGMVGAARYLACGLRRLGRRPAAGCTHVCCVCVVCVVLCCVCCCVYVCVCVSSRVLLE
jgi:hypothetical protein